MHWAVPMAGAIAAERVVLVGTAAKMVAVVMRAVGTVVAVYVEAREEAGAAEEPVAVRAQVGQGAGAAGLMEGDSVAKEAEEGLVPEGGRVLEKVEAVVVEVERVVAMVAEALDVGTEEGVSEGAKEGVVPVAADRGLAEAEEKAPDQGVRVVLEGAERAQVDLAPVAEEVMAETAGPEGTAEVATVVEVAAGDAADRKGRE